MTPNSASKPELDETTPVPKDDETVAVPKADETIAAPKADETVAAPKADETVAVPKADETIAVPKADETVAVPKVDETLAVPKPDETVKVPKTEEPAAAEAPVVEEPTVKEAEAPVVEEPAVEEPVVAAPVAEDPAPPAESVSTEVLTAGDPDDDEDGEDLDDAAALGSTTGYPTLVPLISSLVGLVVLFSLLVVAFALPARHQAPTKLPIGISASPAVAAQVKQLFSANGNHAFEVTTYPNEAALRTGIKHREIYGGLLVGTSDATMLVSSAASPVAAEALSGVANELAQGGAEIPVQDVVPMPKKDPRGTGLAALALPLVIGSVIPALVLALLYRRRTPAQVGGAVGSAVLIGAATAAILTFWLGSTDGANFWLLTLGLAAGVLATTLVLLGLSALGGRIALGVGVAALVLIAAPLSGLNSAPEWLPTPWGSIGQFLPPGANATLLRSTAFFDGHGGGMALIVLGVWALAGLLLLGVSFLLERPAGEPVLEPALEPAV